MDDLIEPNTTDEDEPDERDRVPPDHPASVEQCDHMNCTLESPGIQRICSECTPIMLASYPNECDYCGTTIRD